MQPVDLRSSSSFFRCDHAFILTHPHIDVEQPCLFLATDYILLSHLARSFDKEVSDRCLLIRYSRVTKIFVWSDIITFLLQASSCRLAHYIDMLFYETPNSSLNCGDPKIPARSRSSRGNLSTIAGSSSASCARHALAFSFDLFSVSLSSPGGKLSYTLDSLPLWIVMTLYCVVWPTRALMMRSERLEPESKQQF
ncbi:RTA-like protein [Mycena sanguinolenta]|uniref:RTA-like protein n=1 Tax=Mycena sanguinolenta TaxID=230812 RepID=A0A8H6Z8H9_9AGAR|nr:RTA-like protein [Mycena sanguinolenta]